MSRAPRVLAAAVALLLGGCGPGGNGRAAPSPSQATPVPTPSPAAQAPSPGPARAAPPAGCTEGSGSPDTFDPSRGRYAVYLTGLNPSDRRLAFDLIRFLAGEEAASAYHEDNPSDPEGPPNDYYVVNRSRATRAVPVATDAPIWLLRLEADFTPDLSPGSWEELPAYLALNRPPEGGLLSYYPFWLTMRDGVVTEICEQYVP